MKKTNRLILLAALMAGSFNFAFSQDGSDAYKIGSTESFIGNLKAKGSQNQRTGKIVFDQALSPTEKLSLQINYKKSSGTTDDYLVGNIEGKDGSFLINASGNKLSGNIILHKEKKAYKYYSDEKGNAYVEKTDINNLLCVEYAPKSTKIAQEAPAAPVASAISAAVANLQSFPGAKGCILLDFDGQYVSGTPWNNGNPINAAPSGMSDAAIQEAWEIVSEDFRPFNINITTNEAVYNSYPKDMRMRNIFTPTNTAAPGAGGVAYISSFRWNDDTPCWVFILSGKAGGEAASHEIGHTLSLGHDGRNNPAEGYFAGHGNWAPIMGVGYYKPISQWSRGEYNSANNLEDDLAKISGSAMNLGYRGDAAGNSIAAAANLPVDASGNVNQWGIIETTSDLDYYGFTTGGGTVSLNVNTVGRHGDLDIEVKLFNSGGGQIGSYNGGDLNAAFSVNLGAGKYYISVNGVGAGNPATDGYSDYASIGSYTITGKIPTAVVTGTAIVYKDCNFSGTAVGLGEGSYTLSQLNSRGVANDDVSSLKIQGGYEIVLFDGDNFTGASITITAENTCLVGNGWNDRATSIIIRTTGVTNISGTYYIQNKNSSLYMDVNGNNSNNGAGFMQYNFNGGGNQQFEFVHLGGGVYRITPKHSGKCMDISDVSLTNGALVHQWDYVGGANQQFIVKSNGDGSYKFIAKHSNKIVEVNGMSKIPGERIQQWEDGGQTSGQWKLIPVTTTSSNLIQAENYTYMNGIQTEATTDAGGGLNVGWINPNDWMQYNGINFPTTGKYLIEYRVASMVGGSFSSNLNSGAIVLGTLTVPATNGWQNWTTISQTVSINAGTYNFGIFSTTSDWNINWFRITKVAGAAAGAELATGIEDSKNVSEFTVYPNPASDRLFIQSNLNEEVELVIFDNMGRIVMSKTNDGNALDISTFTNGVYSVMIKSQNNVVTKRFIKN